MAFPQVNTSELVCKAGSGGAQVNMFEHVPGGDRGGEG